MYALVSPSGLIDRYDQNIDPQTGVKAGWRWLSVNEEVGEPLGDTVQGTYVRRGVTEVILPGPSRRMVLKTTITARLIQMGKIDEAYEFLTANPAAFARWFAPNEAINADDPEALAFLNVLGVNPLVVMADDSTN